MKLPDVKYFINNKFGRVATLASLAALLFTGCEKDPVTPEPTPTPTPTKHNVELRYDLRTDAGCVNIAMDTIRKYNADKYVDTIFLIPEPYDQLAVFGTTPVRNGVNYLRERHNVNPNKVFGKGDLKLNYYSVDQNPEIVRFLADTLKYHLVYDNQPNSK